jgi:uncharacterized membrane protein YGL010W
MILIRKFLPAILWAILIFLGSMTQGVSVSNVALVDFLAHKSIHVLEYAVFYVLLYRATGSFWQSIIILGLYAVSDEYHQTFTTGRSPKITDVIIDLASGGLGALFLWKLLPVLPPKLKSWLQKLLKV